MIVQRKQRVLLLVAASLWFSLGWLLSSLLGHCHAWCWCRVGRRFVVVSSRSRPRTPWGPTTPWQRWAVEDNRDDNSNDDIDSNSDDNSDDTIIGNKKNTNPKPKEDDEDDQDSNTLLSTLLKQQAKDSSSSSSSLSSSSSSRWYTIRLPRAMGIDWGTDLSFAYVAVRGMDPTGPAAATGRVQIGDQLCQLTPVRPAVVDVTGGQQPKQQEQQEQEQELEQQQQQQQQQKTTASPIGLIGAPFDYVMTALAELGPTVREVDLVLFRGTKADLQHAVAAATGQSAQLAPATITVTVRSHQGSPSDAPVRVLREVPTGVNLRDLLVNNGINVYQSFTRWTNCKGKQLCGTCIVNITEGALQTNRKSMDEASTLRENPDTYRLSCVTFAYGDVTVETFPPIQASQWTR